MELRLLAIHMEKTTKTTKKQPLPHTIQKKKLFLGETKDLYVKGKNHFKKFFLMQENNCMTL